LQWTALGVADVFLNGRKVGEDFLMPGWSDFRKRAQVMSTDVTALLRPGNNTLGAILGDGWYTGTLLWRNERNHYGTHPQLLARLDIELRDGREVSVTTGRGWQMRTGPVIAADIYHGETHDARQDLGDWCVPGASQVGRALGRSRVFHHALVAGKGDRRQDGDDGDDNQHLGQSEGQQATAGRSGHGGRDKIIIQHTGKFRGCSDDSAKVKDVSANPPRTPTAGWGLYSTAKSGTYDHPDIVEASRLLPKGVVVLLSALNFQGIGTHPAWEVWMQLPANYPTPKVTHPPRYVSSAAVCPRLSWSAS
jgi:hypothetical protein